MSHSKHKKRRSPAGERFFQMHVWLLNSAAWKACSVYERCLYWELKQLYNGQNNGDIALSHREAEKLLNCSNRPILAAFDGLLDKGLIKVFQVGSFHWKNRAPGGRSTRWILTEYPVDYPERSLLATKDFMRWQPPAEKNPRYAHSTPMVRSRHTIEDNMVCAEHTTNSKVYAHGIR